MNITRSRKTVTRLTIMRKTNKISRASSSAVEQGTLNPLVVGSNPSWLTVSCQDIGDRCLKTS